MVTAQQDDIERAKDLDAFGGAVGTRDDLTWRPFLPSLQSPSFLAGCYQRAVLRHCCRYLQSTAVAFKFSYLVTLEVNLGSLAVTEDAAVIAAERSSESGFQPARMRCFGDGCFRQG